MSDYPLLQKHGEVSIFYDKDKIVVKCNRSVLFTIPIEIYNFLRKLKDAKVVIDKNSNTIRLSKKYSITLSDKRPISNVEDFKLELLKERFQELIEILLSPSIPFEELNYKF